jgi:tetratricopeptide (TPR) repeat protein
MLVPVLGIVQVGSQAFANRYTYLPLIGCFIILAWGGAELVGERPLARKWISGVALMVVIAFGFRSYREVAYWKDSVTLFKRCIAVTEDNFMARNNLAVALIAQGRYGEAKEQCLAALRINPRSATVLQNLGVVVAMLGDFTGAKSYLDEAARLEPGTVSTYSRLGLVFTLQGKTQQALDFYRDSLRRQPDDERTCNNLAWLLATNPDPQFRNGAEAVKWAENACVLTHYQATVYLGTLAAAYAEAGRFPEAITTARKAVALARTNGQKDLEQANQRLLELYQAGHPYREEKAANGGVRPSY